MTDREHQEAAGTDAEWFAAYRSGDGAAFERLYRRHRDWAVRIAWRFSGDEDAALDLMQDAFAYLVRAAPRLELRGSLRALLYPVIMRAARDLRVRESRRRPLESAPEPECLPGLPDEVREMFRGLGALQQEVLSLRFADELELSAIAELLEVPIGTVKSRLHNALEQLREKRRAE
jgi:RNA polymerase sigma-70 factor, ECF subfamily